MNKPNCVTPFTCRSVPLASALIIAALMFFCPIHVQANSIVFDTIGPANIYQQSAGLDVGTLSRVTWWNHVGISSRATYEEGAQFTAGFSGNLATVDLGLTYVAKPGAGVTPVNVYLYGDASGSPNNASQTFLGSGTPTSAFLTTTNSLVSFNVIGNVPVTAGTTYWLVLKPAATSGLDVWNSSPVAVGATDLSSYSTWSSLGYPFTAAFRLSALSAASVPDSGATILLMLGSVGTLFVLRRIFPRQQV
ncbi:MAG: hypothetical protein M3Y27_07150 [Acidobacteriota bacterium]|nr:hypothetical protein [Acidobacteriota bacterium]